MTDRREEPIETSGPQQPGSPSTQDAFRLHADPPRVVRLSRKVLAGLAIVAALGIGIALIVALQVRNDAAGPTELFRTENRPTADELRRLPTDYSQIPQLGPALPGDLGRPIRRAQEEGRPIPAQPMPGPNPEEQRRLAEEEAARTSELFVSAQSATAPSGLAPPSAPLSGFPAPVIGGQGEPTAQERQTAFLNVPVDRRMVSPDRVSPPASPYVLQAGTMIPAALVTGIRSDLPGQIIAQVTQSVYDSPSGRYLLVPQGSRLIGEYDSSVSFGQRRVLLVWTRLILPGGRSIILERLPGADGEGFAGLEDGVDYHWGQLFRAAALATILNVGLGFGEDQDDEIAQAIRESSQETVGQAGEEIVSRQLAVPPTLTVRPGHPVQVVVTRDLVLEPQRGL